MEPRVIIGPHTPGRSYQDRFEGKTEFKVEASIDGLVRGSVVWVLQGTQLRIETLQAEIQIPGGNVTSPDYKGAIPFEKLREALAESLFSNEGRFLSAAALLHSVGAEASTEDKGLFLKEQAERAAEAASLNPSRPKRGRGRKNDEHWAWIAKEYEYGARVTGAPIEHIKAELEKEEIFLTYEQVKGQVEQATRNEFLTRPTGKGHMDRELGPAFHKYMAQRKKEEE